MAFDYTAALEAVIQDLTLYLPELAHIRVPQVLVSIAQARRRTRYGHHAKCVPLAEQSGRPTLFRYRGRSILYVLYFYLPRFHDGPFKPWEDPLQKRLETVIHECYHIAPAFDGRLRRIGRGRSAHGPSLASYDRKMARLTSRYLAARRDAPLLDFFRVSTFDLARLHGPLKGLRIPEHQIFSMAD